MIGPGGVKVPDQTQGLNLGTKTVKDLISDNVRISVTGKNVKVSGDVKNINEPWTAFSKDDNTGHFLPLQLPDVCKGQKITIKGRKKGNRTATVDDDLLLIQRLENLSGTTMEIDLAGETLMKVDLTGVIPVGEKAYDAQKTDFGGFGESADYVDKLKITWDGAKGKATGELKNFTGPSSNGSVQAGRHFPLGLSAWYADGIPKTVCGKPITDKDIIVNVKSKETPITVEYNGMTVIELDISGMTLGE